MKVAFLTSIRQLNRCAIAIITIYLLDNSYCSALERPLCDRNYYLSIGQ
ncbi:MAG: hypothetical protein SWX82_19745 [Cyanobacteriota bacterium]|nr:hypothetical protein [Cyanobacteriota bacterium]